MNNLEECVIGSILLSKNCFPDVLQPGLKAEHFSPADSDVFRTLVGMHDSGEAIDEVTLANALIKAGKYSDEDGAAAAVMQWMEKLPNAAHATYYAEKVVELGRLRQTLNAIKELAKAAQAPTLTPDDVRVQLQAAIEVDDRLSTDRKQHNCSADSLVSHAEFMARETVETYLIDDVMVSGHNLCLAGPPKLGKTMLVADAAVSLGAGTPFLGHFEVTETVPVLMLSGESGEKTLRRYCKVIQDQRGVDGSGVQITWGMQLPALSDSKDLLTLERIIEKHGFRVVIIDPIYLALLKGGGSKTDTHRLMEMGLLLGEISDIGQRTGQRL